jgi:hypothetical protein
MCTDKHVMQSVSLNDTRPKRLVTGIEECTSSLQVINGSERCMYVGTESGTIWYVINPGHFLVTPVETGKIYYWVYKTDFGNGDGAKICVSSEELSYSSGLITADTSAPAVSSNGTKGTANHVSGVIAGSSNPNISVFTVKISNNNYKKGYIIVSGVSRTPPLVQD